MPRHFPRFKKSIFIYCFLFFFFFWWHILLLVSLCQQFWFIFFLELNNLRERKWWMGTVDKALIFWSRMQMWGLVTFTRDMPLAFYVRNFPKTSTLMDVWTCGWGHLEMSFQILCKFLVLVIVIIMILS